MTYRDREEWTANHPFGWYTVLQQPECEMQFVLRPFIAGPSNYATADEAKRAAEADYEAKVLSSLTSEKNDELA